MCDCVWVFAENEEKFQGVVDEFYSVCTRRKLKVNAGQNKVMVFEKTKVKVVDFNVSFRVSEPAAERCE